MYCHYGGVKDTKLKERLSEVAQPTVAEFTRLIDAHMHAKAASTPLMPMLQEAGKQVEAEEAARQTKGGPK